MPELKEFARFQELFNKGVKTSKKYDSALQDEAKKWFEENFNAVFGSTSRCDDPGGLVWHFSIGSLMVGCKPLGCYYYKFIIKMIFFELWDLKEWREGFKYGRHCMKAQPELTNDNYRNGNPYPEQNFYSRAAWDAGYIMGLYNFSFIKTFKICQS